MGVGTVFLLGRDKLCSDDINTDSILHTVTGTIKVGGACPHGPTVPTPNFLNHLLFHSLFLPLTPIPLPPPSTPFLPPPTLFLSLFFLHRFQIQDIQLEDESMEMKSAKEALLLWCQRKTAG